jgi:hypothetical protein
MKIFKRKTIVGIDAIMACAGWRDLTTVIDRMIAYEDCPVKKINGRMVVPRREFKKWLKQNPDAAAERKRPTFEIVQYRVKKTRWGFGKIEQRKITY